MQSIEFVFVFCIEITETKIGYRNNCYCTMCNNIETISKKLHWIRE